MNILAHSKTDFLKSTWSSSEVGGRGIWIFPCQSAKFGGDHGNSVSLNHEYIFPTNVWLTLHLEIDNSSTRYKIKGYISHAYIFFEGEIC